jgi:hypothetical protein
MTLPKKLFATALSLFTLASILVRTPHFLALSKRKAEKSSKTPSSPPRSAKSSEARLSPCPTVAAESFFERRIVPLFDQNCFVCHGGTVQRSDLDLRSEESLLKGGASGPSIVPGNAKESLLYQLVTHKREPAMPMGGEKLSAEDVKAIEDWINSLSPAETLHEPDKPVTSTGPPGGNGRQK